MLQFFLFLLTLSVLQAKDIAPQHRFKAIDYVSDFVFTNRRLYAASNEGVVTIFDLKTKKIIDTINISLFTQNKNSINSLDINALSIR